MNGVSGQIRSPLDEDDDNKLDIVKPPKKSHSHKLILIIFFGVVFGLIIYTLYADGLLNGLLEKFGINQTIEENPPELSSNATNINSLYCSGSFYSISDGKLFYNYNGVKIPASGIDGEVKEVIENQIDGLYFITAVDSERNLYFANEGGCFEPSSSNSFTFTSTRLTYLKHYILNGKVYYEDKAYTLRYLNIKRTNNILNSISYSDEIPNSDIHLYEIEKFFAIDNSLNLQYGYENFVTYKYDNGAIPTISYVINVNGSYYFIDKSNFVYYLTRNGEVVTCDLYGVLESYELINGVIKGTLEDGTQVTYQNYVDVSALQIGLLNNNG